MPDPITGHKAKLFRNTGTVAAPVWSEIDEVVDVSIADLTMGLAELKRRSNNFTKTLPSIIQMIAVEARWIYGTDPTNFDVVRANFFAGIVEQYAIFSGDILVTGNEGLTIPLAIENFPWDQPLEDITGFDVRWVTGYFVEASVEIDPVWLVTP